MPAHGEAEGINRSQSQAYRPANRPRTASAPPVDVAGHGLPITRAEFLQRNQVSYGLPCPADKDPNECAALLQRELPVLRASMLAPVGNSHQVSVFASPLDAETEAFAPLRWGGEPAIDAGDVVTYPYGELFIDSYTLDIEQDQIIRVYFQPVHVSADYKQFGVNGAPGADFIVDFQEIDLAILRYSSGSGPGIACPVGEEPGDDGFVFYGTDPQTNQSTNRLCLPYTQDYNPQDWKINLSELLRITQFYNTYIFNETYSYYYCPDEGTEDGFCPGSTP